ncbi:MAG TPA: VOC family protein [Gaiellaceae bacterium]|nr:VOC family protein [Gaiellaceae bacterium]
MIGVERTDYVSLPVRDLARATAFYGETLGIERNPKAPASNPEFETGNLTISLREEPGAAPSTGYVALRVADVDAARRQLLELGVELDGETFDTGVCHVAFFTDPDGNRLCIHRRYAG